MRDTAPPAQVPAEKEGRGSRRRSGAEGADQQQHRPDGGRCRRCRRGAALAAGGRRSGARDRAAVSAWCRCSRRSPSAPSGGASAASASAAFSLAFIMAVLLWFYVMGLENPASRRCTQFADRSARADDRPRRARHLRHGHDLGAGSPRRAGPHPRGRFPGLCGCDRPGPRHPPGGCEDCNMPTTLSQARVDPAQVTLQLGAARQRRTISVQPARWAAPCRLPGGGARRWTRAR